MRVLEKVYRLELTEEELLLVGSVMRYVTGGASVSEAITGSVGVENMKEVVVISDNHILTDFRLEVL